MYVAGLCQSLQLGDTKANGNSEVSRGASEEATGIHSTATSQDSGTSGKFAYLVSKLHYTALYIPTHNYSICSIILKRRR